MIGWALRWVLLWCGMIVLATVLIRRGDWLPPLGTARSATVRGVPGATESEPGPASATLVYPADRAGHIMIDAVVNGAPTRMLVDTGASLVTLTPTDARAAGVDPGGLVFDRRASTANGIVRMAPVMLREIRIGQLAIDNVPAAVIEHLDVSLLGMSFLGKLRSYEMRDGRLTITW